METKEQSATQTEQQYVARIVRGSDLKLFRSARWWDQFDPFSSKAAGYQSAPGLSMALRYMDENGLLGGLCEQR